MNCWSMPCQSKLAPREQHCFHASQGMVPQSPS